MKKILCIFFICAPLFLHAQPADETLSNADIVKLSKLDLPPLAIISKIKDSKTHFDISINALADLKKEGVNGEVISEMIIANSHERKEVANQKDFRDPKTMRKDGIYYFNRSDTNNLFIPIDPTVVSNSKSGGLGTALAQRYSYGIAKNKQISLLSSAHSRRQIPHVKPRFYFYFNQQTSISPNEFALVKLSEKKNSREMVVGTSNAYGVALGIDEKEKVDFAYDMVADGIYKVYPKNALEAGEYCFVYTGSAPTIFSNNKVYDFGVPEPEN